MKCKASKRLLIISPLVERTPHSFSEYCALNILLAICVDDECTDLRDPSCSEWRALYGYRLFNDYRIADSAKHYHRQS